MTELDRATFLRRTGGILAAAAAAEWTNVAHALGGADPRLRELARAVRGPVLTRASAAYNAARLLVDPRFDAVRPLAIVQPLGTEDIRRTVLWARRHGVRLAVRAGGHSYGGYSTCSGVVLDLRRLNGIRVDVRKRTATIGAGALLVDVLAGLTPHGVDIPHGSCPTVGVAGLTLGGGVGLASRAWGTSSDSVLSLGIVTADGRARRCSERREPDLFWACRGGGGGNFGVVTGFTFRVHRAPPVAWFTATWPWAQAAEVVAAWQAFAPHAPDALFSLCTLGTGVSGPQIECFGQFLGTESRLAAVLAPLRRVSGISLRTGTSSYLEAQLRWGGCLGKTLRECAVPTRVPFAARSDYALTPLRASGIALLRRAVERAQSDGLRGSVILDSYGGAINRIPARATAFVHRDALFSLQEYTSWSGGGSGAAEHAWLRRLHAELRPHVSGFAYQNYIDPELATWRHAYYGRNYARLVEVKRRVDPENVFHFAQSIPTH